MSIHLYPSKIKNKVIKKLLYFWTSQFEKIHYKENKNRCTCGDRSVLYASCVIDNLNLNKNSICIGSDTHVLGNLQVFPHGGHIEIGNYCYIGDQSKIWSMNSIYIGNRVLISHGVNIHDHNAHPISANERHIHFKTIIDSGHPKELHNVITKAVFIEDDAWIGFNATIMKGVRVGRGAIVGACSMVTKDVAPFSIVVGTPARVVGTALP